MVATWIVGLIDIRMTEHACGVAANQISPRRIGGIGPILPALGRPVRGLVSELPLTPVDGVPTDCVVNFDNLQTIPREALRRRLATLPPARMAAACRALQAATGC